MAAVVPADKAGAQVTARAGVGEEKHSTATASDDNTALHAVHAELRQIKDVAKQYLQVGLREEDLMKTTQAMLRVTLEKLQSMVQPQQVAHVRHLDDHPEDQPDAPDINQLVRQARQSPTALLQILEGIKSEAQLAQMDEDSVSTMLPALCDSLCAELVKELVSLKDVLQLATALITFVDFYPDATRQLFQQWGDSVRTLTDALLAFSQNRQVQHNIQSVPPPLPCQLSEIINLAAHIQDVSGLRRPQEQRRQMLPPQPKRPRGAGWGSDENGFWPAHQQGQHQHQHQHPHPHQQGQHQQGQHHHQRERQHRHQQRQPALQYKQGLWN